MKQPYNTTIHNTALYMRLSRNFSIAIHLATYRGERTLASIVELAIQINKLLQIVHKRHLHIFFRKRMQILKALICIRDYSIFSTFFSKDFHKHIIIRTQ